MTARAAAGPKSRNEPRYAASAAVPVSSSIIVAVRAPLLAAMMSPGGLMKPVETA